MSDVVARRDPVEQLAEDFMARLRRGERPALSEYTAAHPDGRYAFVTDAAQGEIVVLDVLRGTVVGRVEVGARARHVSIDPAGRRVWVALGSKASEIAVVAESVVIARVIAK